MTFAIDTNLLLCAANDESDLHAEGTRVLQQVYAGPEIAYVFWPVVFGFVRMSTHPGIFAHPLTPDRAIESVDRLIARPHVQTGDRTDVGLWRHYVDATRGFVVRGNDVPDAHLVALMRQHDVTTIWSNDRGFRRFDGIRVVNPFVER